MQAGTGGDLLIAGSGANRRLVGGAGRDVFLFAQAAAGTVDDVLGFGTGLSADRIWLLQPGGDSAYVTVGPNGVVLSYSTAGGQAAQLRLNGVALADLSSTTTCSARAPWISAAWARACRSSWTR